MEPVTVLIAEDEDEWSHFVTCLLPPERYRVVAVRTAKEALRFAREHQPALAIVDLNLPDMFGVDLCRSLKRLPGLDGLNVVALSSLDHSQAPDPDMHLDGFVTKTSAQRQLLPTIELLQRKASLKS